MKIAYLTDSHLGADGLGFHQQPYWVGGQEQLLKRLQPWLDENHVEMIIHGGDLIDHGTETQAKQALDQLVGLGRPILACLGNHDICQPDALEMWQRVASQHPMVTLADAHVRLDECDLYALNNHWQAEVGPEMYWDPTPPFRHTPCLAASQLEWLDKQLALRTDRPAMLIVHTQIEPVPPTAPKLEPYIPVSYPQQLNAILDQHKHCCMVLTGHCHVTTAVPTHGRMHLTTAAFGEVPFHVRLIDISNNMIKVETHSLADGDLNGLPSDLTLDQSHAWSLGNDTDQQFILPLCDGCTPGKK